MMQRGIETIDTLELLLWSRTFAKYTRPSNALTRFTVGCYQIGQYMSWNGTDSAHESIMAAVVHFMGTAEVLGISLENALPKKLDSLSMEKFSPVLVLRSQSLLQQQIIYSKVLKSMERSSRFKEEIAIQEFDRIICHLIGAVPVNKRKEAVFHATGIMTGRL